MAITPPFFYPSGYRFPICSLGYKAHKIRRRCVEIEPYILYIPL